MKAAQNRGRKDSGILKWNLRANFWGQMSVAENY